MLYINIIGIGFGGNAIIDPNETFHETLVPGETKDIIVGDSSRDLSIEIEFDATGDSLHQSGNLEISIPYTNYVDEDVFYTYVFDDVGLNVSVFLDGSDVVLRLLLDSIAIGAFYGYLYNWYALDGLAPAGWHAPTRTEWTTLSNYLGGFSVAGGKLKSTGTLEEGTGLWRDPNTGATNETGFSALPGGYRSSHIGTPGEFGNFEYSTYLMASTVNAETNNWIYILSSNLNLLGESNAPKQEGKYVRFVRDNAIGWIEGDKIMDADGNEYDTVQIGDQIWTVQNWACTKLANGTPIANVTEDAEWAALETGAYCAYDNDENNVFLFEQSLAFDYALEKITSTTKGVIPVTYDDWFLPSQDELIAMRTELYEHGLGNFTESEEFATGTNFYQSSSEYEPTPINAHTQRFYLTGSNDYYLGKNVECNVRACRTFTGTEEDYPLRSTGQAGGLVFAHAGGLVYEASPVNVGRSIWSNITTEIGATAQGTAIGTGVTNTAAIIAQGGHTASAAKLCNDYTVLL